MVRLGVRLCIFMVFVSMWFSCSLQPEKHEKQEERNRLQYEPTNVTITEPIVLEAENARLSGSVGISHSIPGYSGEGFVEMGDSGSIDFPVNIESEGFYSLAVMASTPGGNKTQMLAVNGAIIGDMLFPASDSWFDFNAGNIFLKVGSNSISIQKSWGWMNFDRIVIGSGNKLHDYSRVEDKLRDPQANADARRLFSLLRSLYGKKVISGQCDLMEETLTHTGGKVPVIQAFDMMDYSPNNPWREDGSPWDDGSAEAAIDWYNNSGQKGIVSFQWHWYSPIGGVRNNPTFYVDFTDFDVSKAVQPGTAEYDAIIEGIDLIAVQLKKLQNAGVPVLWRPLHEAGGGWFWWGAKGPVPVLALWDILYERLTIHHGLHNLIWVWSTPEPDWYPGNDKVDILGYDSYPGDYVYSAQKPIFDSLYDLVDGKRIIALSENGPLPDIDALMLNDARWSYFVSWRNFLWYQTTDDYIIKIFNHKDVLTMDKM